MNSYSIYVPRVKTFDHDENFFKNYFAWFGCVSRVDFVALDDAYSSNGRFRKAFVHFESVFAGYGIVNQVLTVLENGESYRVSLYGGDYMILLKNKVPVAATTLNIHQLAENYRLLEEKSRGMEEKMKALEEKSKGLEETVARQEDMLDRTQQVVDQLIGKLNMPESEIREYERVLMGVKENDDEDSDYDIVNEDIEDDMLSFDMLEKKYGKLKYNQKTGDFTDGDGFVRYVNKHENGEYNFDYFLNRVESDEENDDPYETYADYKKRSREWYEKYLEIKNEKYLEKEREKEQDLKMD